MTPTVDPDVRQDVADLFVRYATGIDRRDWTLFRTCFTADCDADYGDIGAWHGGDAITEWMARAHDPCGHTMHRITNVHITPSGAGLTTRCYVDAIIMLPDNKTGFHATGYFDDELVRTDNGWQITRRRYTMVLFQSLRNAERPRR